jgi:uncharacterized protein YdhG (YjbR/CyaY superfamily)
MAKAAANSVDAYLASLPSPAQAALARVRAALRRALPGAEEVISYQMPAFRLHGRIVVYVAGWKDHLSVYPSVGRAAALMKAELAPYQASKGTLRFPLARPAPVRLIARFARLRAEEARERGAARTAKGQRTPRGTAPSVRRRSGRGGRGSAA